MKGDSDAHPLLKGGSRAQLHPKDDDTTYPFLKDSSNTQTYPLLKDGSDSYLLVKDDFGSFYLLKDVLQDAVILNLSFLKTFKDLSNPTKHIAPSFQKVQLGIKEMFLNKIKIGTKKRKIVC